MLFVQQLNIILLHLSSRGQQPSLATIPLSTWPSKVTDQESTMTLMNVLTTRRLMGASLEPRLSSEGWGVHLWWSSLLFQGSCLVVQKSLRHAQLGVNQAPLEMTLLAQLPPASLERRSLTSDPCSPPPSPASFTKSFNPGSSVTPPFIQMTGYMSATPCTPPHPVKSVVMLLKTGREQEESGGLLIKIKIKTLPEQEFLNKYFLNCWFISVLKKKKLQCKYI